MVAEQLAARDIEDERVLAALGRVPRELFVHERDRGRAYEDRPLEIGFGQTISQPYMVALLAGEVDSIERIPELAELARRNLAAAGYEHVRVHVGDGSLGLPERAPFDAIVVAAAAPGVPEALYAQLAPQGRLVVPVGGPGGQRLEVVIRSPEGPAVAHSVPCRFVPLVGAEGFGEPFQGREPGGPG